MKSYGGKPKAGTEYFDVRDGQIYSRPFGREIYDRYFEYDDYDDNDEQHYEVYAGTYAQDVAGFSDEEIDEIFDGEPDAYWNID